MHEELAQNNDFSKTKHPRILKVREELTPLEDLPTVLDIIEKAIESNDYQTMFVALKSILLVNSELNTSDVFVVEANNASAQSIDAKDHTLVTNKQSQ